jgi:N-acetylmuramoyl-L-alanine amidase
MKIAIRGGHNYGVPGASAIVDEVTEDRKYYKSVINYLKSAGHEVLDVTPGNTSTSSDDLCYGVSKANNWGADLFVSCHINCDGGHGCEVLYVSSKGQEYASKVNNAIANLGFTNRGAKADERGLYELRHTSMPAIIIEPFFLDSQNDVSLYNKVGFDAIGKAIAEAISGKSINVIETTPKYSPAPVQSSSDSSDSNVKDLQHSLNRLFNAGLAEDGIVGPCTNKAIATYGDIFGGIRAISEMIKACNECLRFPLLKVGSQGYSTRYLQYRLGIGHDGDFGPQTAREVREYQFYYHLQADAIVGPQTWTQLMK